MLVILCLRVSFIALIPWTIIFGSLLCLRIVSWNPKMTNVLCSLVFLLSEIFKELKKHSLIVIRNEQKHIFSCKTICRKYGLQKVCFCCFWKKECTATKLTNMHKARGHIRFFMTDYFRWLAVLEHHLSLYDWHVFL